MVIFFLASVESCEDDYGISSREEEVWPSSPKKERSRTMAIFLPSSVKSCGSDHGISSKEEEVLPSVISSKEEEVCSSYP